MFLFISHAPAASAHNYGLLEPSTVAQCPQGEQQEATLKTRWLPQHSSVTKQIQRLPAEKVNKLVAVASALLTRVQATASEFPPLFLERVSRPATGETPVLVVLEKGVDWQIFTWFYCRFPRLASLELFLWFCFLVHQIAVAHLLKIAASSRESPLHVGVALSRRLGRCSLAQRRRSVCCSSPP